MTEKKRKIDDWAEWVGAEWEVTDPPEKTPLAAIFLRHNKNDLIPFEHKQELNEVNPLITISDVMNIQDPVE